MEFILY